MSIDINKYNSLFTSVSDYLSCGPECEFEKESERLKDEYLKAQSNLASAPSEVRTTQKKYVTFTEGEDAYNKLKESQLEEQADKIATSFQRMMDKSALNINIDINSYEGVYYNIENIIDLYLKYKEENIMLSKNSSIKCLKLL
jgi:hypothetical protein